MNPKIIVRTNVTPFMLRYGMTGIKILSNIEIAARRFIELNIDKFKSANYISVFVDFGGITTNTKDGFIELANKMESQKECVKIPSVDGIDGVLVFPYNYIDTSWSKDVAPRVNLDAVMHEDENKQYDTTDMNDYMDMNNYDNFGHIRWIATPETARALLDMEIYTDAEIRQRIILLLKNLVPSINKDTLIKIVVKTIPTNLVDINDKYLRSTGKLLVRRFQFVVKGRTFYDGIIHVKADNEDSSYTWDNGKLVGLKVMLLIPGRVLDKTEKTACFEKSYSDVIRESIKLHGPLLKTHVCMEEMGELIQAISKELRGEGDIEHLSEEIADVYLCLEYLKTIYNIDESKINYWKEYKMARQVKRDYDLKEKLGGNTPPKYPTFPCMN